MKINRFPILMIIFILALALANPVQADKFTDTPSLQEV
jgi:hypothetical protein